MYMTSFCVCVCVHVHVLCILKIFRVQHVDQDLFSITTKNVKENKRL